MNEVDWARHNLAGPFYGLQFKKQYIRFIRNGFSFLPLNPLALPAFQAKASTMKAA